MPNSKIFYRVVIVCEGGSFKYCCWQWGALESARSLRATVLCGVSHPLMARERERERVDRKCSGIDSCCHSSMCLWLLDYNLNCFVFLIPRQSTRWWGLLSWWRWTRTAWRPSSGSTKSSVRWIRITTTRSHWKSSKKQQRVTRPLYYCCSVTCKNERGGKKRARDCIND